MKTLAVILLCFSPVFTAKIHPNLLYVDDLDTKVVAGGDKRKNGPEGVGKVIDEYLIQNDSKAMANITNVHVTEWETKIHTKLADLTDCTCKEIELKLDQILSQLGVIMKVITNHTGNGDDRDYQFTITTADWPFAGTTATILVQLVGINSETDKISLRDVQYLDDKPYEQRFQFGSVDSFVVKHKNIGKVSKLRLFHTGNDDGWFVHKILIDIMGLEEKYQFTANLWLDTEPGYETEVDLLPDQIK